MGKAAVIFPGQGAQVVGMGREAADSSARASAVFDRAGEVLGFDIAQVCFEGPAERLEQTDIQQPAIFVVSVALWEAFLEAGGSCDFFSWTGGLSLGEYTALHVAGALGFDEGLRLVRRRGELMQEAAEASPSGMVCLIGADREAADAVCDRARGSGVLGPANFNCPGQVVISGDKAACERATEAAPDFNCRAIELAVAGAFHSPLMKPAAEGLWPVLTETPFTKPEIPVIANVDAEPHGEPDAIRESLRRQVTQPVLWQRCVEHMMAGGVDRFVEIGPGRVLAGLMRKTDRKVPVMSINTCATIEDVIAKLTAD